MKRIGPPAEGSRKERIEKIFSDISRWVYSDELKALFELYCSDSASLFTDDILSTVRNVDNRAGLLWDYRAKQQNGGERWFIENELIEEKYGDVIIDCAAKLGMAGITDTSIEPDYILPLGGARMQNYYRPLMARHIVDAHDIKNKKIVALGSGRPLADIEKEHAYTYAPGAATEYDALRMGLAKAFGVPDSFTADDHMDEDNPNLNRGILKMDTAYNGNGLHALAAPSTDPERRANSIDTFLSFFKCFEPKEGSSILLVTTQIYVNYQLARFLPFALEYDLKADCVGMDDTITGGVKAKPVNYMQEIKAVINSLRYLTELYKDEYFGSF